MKITVLDKCTVTTGDVSLLPLEEAGEVKYYDTVPHKDLPEYIADSDAVIVNKAIIDADVMDACPNLKFIGLFATGFNNIDTAAAKERGIAVCNVPGYSTDSVAQLTFSFILWFATNIGKYVSSVAKGDWANSETFSYLSFPITELRNKTLGIFGYGTIGKAVSEIALSFGMKVIAVSHHPQTDDRVTFVSKEELFRESDFLTFHCPLTEETKNLVNRESLSLMKKTAFLINTSRGGVIVEEDLRDALNNGIIAGAGIDVLTIEPMRQNHPFMSAKNIIMTPHVAWASLEARTRLIDVVRDNMLAFLRGEKMNRVD